MFKNLKLLIINHLGIIILTIVIIVSIYFIFSEVLLGFNTVTNKVVQLSNALDNNTVEFYDNAILTGSQVLTTIKKYYNDSDVMMLLLNNKDDYNHASYRFWVTGKGGKYGQNTNYESIIFSNDYNNVSSLLIQEKSINSKYSKKSLDSYSDTKEKNYINLSNNYKSVLLKCNNYILGIAFLAI